MAVQAALLDEQGVFVRVDELESEALLTDRHLPHITECDLPPGKYRWIAEAQNPMGGAFWPLEWLKRVGAQ